MNPVVQLRNVRDYAKALIAVIDGQAGHHARIANDDGACGMEVEISGPRYRRAPGLIPVRGPMYMDWHEWNERQIETWKTIIQEWREES